MIAKTGRSKWTVESESVKNLEYIVIRKNDKLYCECSAYEHNHVCKHTVAVITLQAQKHKKSKKNILLSLLGMFAVICTEYEDRNTVRNDNRKKVRLEPMPRHLCKQCNCTLIIDPGFKRRYFPVYIITLALLPNFMKSTPKETSLVLSKSLKVGICP